MNKDKRQILSQTHPLVGKKKYVCDWGFACYLFSVYNTTGCIKTLV